MAPAMRLSVGCDHANRAPGFSTIVASSVLGDFGGGVFMPLVVSPECEETPFVPNRRYTVQPVITIDFRLSAFNDAEANALEREKL